MPSCLSFALLLLSAAADPTATAEKTAAAENLALFATPATSFVSDHETLSAVNDGFEPAGVNDHRHGAYGNWPRTGTQWVELAWSQPISTRKIDVYWWADGRGIRLPAACRLSYWDGNGFVAVRRAAGLGVVGGRYNPTTFAEVSTTRLRLEFDGDKKFSTGILEWKVYDSGKSPKFAPRVTAGPDRVVVLPAKTFLRGATHGAVQTCAWRRTAGPGPVRFADAQALVTTAEFSTPGDYVLELTAANGERSASDRLHVRVEGPAPRTHRTPVATGSYSIDSPFWSKRLKQQIVNWIPHCIAELSKPDLKEGGFANFTQAGAKNAGRPHKPHVGPPWSNAYTLNTVESMCLALLLDPQGDADLMRAQEALRAQLEEWIPLILKAQEPDGYLQTRFTLGTAAEHGQPAPRWTRVGDHEGYVAGYFLDAAVAHFWLTGGRDRRMYDAAKKLADCWDAHIGPPPKKAWYDGHEELEQALVRFGRLVHEAEGPGRGDKYVRLAKFLLDCRQGGSSYDQSHVPVVEQYEALGHAVRAAYCYSAITDVAMETGDAQYHSAAKSLWNNLVNAKYYVTGGLGSGETSEGFGGNFSLPNNAYSETCADCGLLFFQHKMNLAYGSARYADLLEDTLYNAILGAVDLPAKNFTYTNPLDQSHARYAWHACPCCVGNIPRTLLMLPTWMYAQSADDVLVNLYVGSTVRVSPELSITQRTEYPWKGSVELVVNPAQAKEFAVHLRVPHRNASELYRATPEVGGLSGLSVNGTAVAPEIKDGYAIVRRQWKAGDTVRLALPLAVQRIRADERIAADRGRVALRYGPLVYNIESVDQNVEGRLPPDAELTTRWEPQLLDGLLTIRGKFADGSPLVAIPNYARNNRGGRSIVWIAEKENAPAPAAPPPAGAPQKVALSVDPQRVLHTIDPNVYGHFLEHIYHSCNGGLWGDLVWNRSFEELPGGGRWRSDGQEIVQSSLADNVRLVFGDPRWSDYEFTLQAQKTDGHEGFLVLFRVKSDQEFYWVNLGGWGNQSHGLERGRVGETRWRGVGKRTPGSIETGRWYNVRVRCEGPHLQVWLDDQRVVDFTDNAQGHLRGAVGIGSWVTKTRYRNLKVTSLDGKPLFAGLPELTQSNGQARHWTPYGPGRSATCEAPSLNGEFCQQIVGQEGETGVEQSALCLRAGDVCRGSFWARGKASGALVARLLDGKTTLIEKSFPAPDAEWKEVPLEFRLERTVENATLQIGLRGAGEIWIDQVSLMPDSCRAAGGFRPDLLKAVAELRPPVIRWPGGCYAERYRWQDGLGPQHKRGKFPISIWDDVDSNNLGTDEFVDLCRRVKAAPLVVVNIGRHDRHTSREAYVKEACAWIEYCNGPADSTWGKVRAAQGHPQPYNVGYWEIDNETWGLGAEAYAEYVQLFAPAMRKVDPRIKIAVCGSAGYGREKNGLEWNRILIERCAGLFDYLSIHHYENPNRFAEGPGQYEEFFRATGELIARSKNPRAMIFISEWNAQSTDWRTGLYGGGILNAFERTARVGMAAPALFLRHVSATNWDNAFINFDQSGWFPAPNYVVLKLWHDHFAPQLVALDGPQPPLNATAALSADGKRLVLKAVNPGRQAIELSLSVRPGFRVGQAQLLVVAPGSLEARNTLAEPHKIRPQPSPAACAGQTVHCTLPPLSAGVLIVEP